MQTKLTVRVGARSVANAKRFAAEHGTTLSALIDAYLRRLPDAPEGELGMDIERTPALRRLTGIIEPATTIQDYHQHLLEKHAR